MKTVNFSCFKGRFIKENIMLKLFSFFKIPLLSYVKPKIIFLSKDKSIVQVKLTSRTKNHLNSMYFGAINIGAESAIGILASQISKTEKSAISFIFKRFEIEFKRKAMTNVYFYCDDAVKVTTLINRAITTKKRVDDVISGHAYCTCLQGKEIIATFNLTLSIRAK